MYKWATKTRLFWASKHDLWAPNNGIYWAPKYGANFTHFGRPHHYLWNSTLLHWTATLLFGRPRNLVDTQDTAILVAHIISWTATKLLWVPIRECGHPAHQCWATITRNMGNHHALMCYHVILYGRPDYAEGVPRLFVGTHAKNVVFHAFRWTGIISLWCSTKCIWATTENMWSFTHLAGLPHDCYGLPRTIVDTHHKVVGAHNALWT